MSKGWFVTAFDGVPTGITYNGQPIDRNHTYKVAINNYMYTHDSVPFSDPSPQTSSYLARTALVEFASQFQQANPYSAGGPRYSLNTEFSGGYRAVVTMMNDADSSYSFDDAFIRLQSALPETLARRGSTQVPTSLVNADGSINSANRLSEIEHYRSYLGFKTGALKPGDIIEVWGKGGFYNGDPEFVDRKESSRMAWNSRSSVMTTASPSRPTCRRSPRSTTTRTRTTTCASSPGRPAPTPSATRMAPSSRS